MWWCQLSTSVFLLKVSSITSESFVMSSAVSFAADPSVFFLQCFWRIYQASNTAQPCLSLPTSPVFIPKLVTQPFSPHQHLQLQLLPAVIPAPYLSSAVSHNFPSHHFTTSALISSTPAPPDLSSFLLNKTLRTFPLSFLVLLLGPT